MRWRSPITLLVLVVLLVGGAWLGYQALTSSNPSQATGPVTPGACIQWKTIPAGTTITAKAILVNVYNAGSKSGEAAKVLASLHARGFRAGVAANPPAGIEADNVTIRTERPHSPVTTMVKDQFNGTVLVTAGPAISKGLDVIIGSAYAGINPKAATKTVLAAPVRVCIAHSTQ